MRCGTPAARPRRRAPSTPPAGPEYTRLTGAFAASSTPTTPPLDCMKRTSVSRPRPSRRRSAYEENAGSAYALTTVVLARAYSRMRGSISDEREIRSCGWRSRATASTSSSFSGLAYALSRQMATASQPCATRSSSTAAISSRSGARVISPVASVRSPTSSRSHRGTSGSTGDHWTSYGLGFSPDPISSRSRKPRVETRPTTAPFRSRTRFVTIVVACRNRPMSAGSSSAAAIAPDSPSSGSGVDNVFALPTSCDASSNQTRSVNVPPMSIPTRFMQLPSLRRR